MKSKKIEEKIIPETIVPSDMDQVLIGAFNRYAKTVLTDRAVPDVRDGLKPVQRRIIFDMFDQGQVFSKPTVKCATIVGHVMGHYHPHGDSSIYDALVHLSQNWKMEEPLIDFQGNNGGLDDDPAAAYRYTEARLSSLSEYLVKGLNKNTVSMVPTFDDKHLEPVVLPSLFPNLLVNGSSGIAVGSSTYIPSHNLHEVIQATIYRINHKRANTEDLMQYIIGPDFPTGGLIDDKAAIKNIYETGKGSFYLYSHAYINHEENEIIIDQIPYGVVKKDFVTALLKRKQSDNLDNIEEITDQSAKEDVTIVIKIKKGASCEDVLNYLMSKGALRTTISCHFLAIDKGHPKTMALLEMLDAYISHQREIETKACQYDLKVADDRLEIVDGLINAYPIIDELIDKIRKCDGKEGVIKMLIADYDFTSRQAEAIAMLPLYRLSNTDIVALRKEKDELVVELDRLDKILNDPEKLDHEIITNLKTIDKQFAKDRKTTILDEKISFTSVDQTKLIAKEECYVAITKDGYAKRSSPKSYNASYESNKKNDPLNIPKMKQGDLLVFDGLCNTHDFILFFTDLGNYGYFPVYMLTDLKWKEEGKHINNLLTLKGNEKIVKAFRIEKFFDGLNVAILTAENKIKRVTLKELEQSALTKKTLRCCKLLNDRDKVVGVEITTGNSDLIVVDELGRSSRFNEGDVPLVGLNAIGVKAIASSIENAKLVSLLSFASYEASLMLVLSSRRGARLISSGNIQATERLGAKTNLIKVFKQKPMRVVSVSKAYKYRGKPSYVGISTIVSNTAIDLAPLSPVELNSEMRENIPGLGQAEVLGKHDFGSVIDSTIPVETPRPVKVSAVKVKSDDADSQLSLFDLFEKETNH